MTELWKIIKGDAKESLSAIECESVDCCVTSPPYFMLRDYGYDGQIGLENTVEEYVSRLVDVFSSVRDVLKDDGTLWVNIGDSYNASKSGNRDGFSRKQSSNRGSLSNMYTKKVIGECKPKDLIGIPWMVAFALREDGWYLRNDIIWAKPNPMVESITDRCTKSHEHIFLFSKSSRYYFDSEAIREDTADGGKRTKRDVWTVPTGSGYRDENGVHYATYNTKLIEPCILAGSRENGIVLDPFSGTGTTGVCALQNGRKYIGIDMSTEYVEMSRKRLERETAQYKIDSFCI